MIDFLLINKRELKRFHFCRFSVDVRAVKTTNFVRFSTVDVISIDVEYFSFSSEYAMIMLNLNFL